LLGEKPKIIYELENTKITNHTANLLSQVKKPLKDIWNI